MIKHASELSVATPDFIDALTGGPPDTPSPTVSSPPMQTPEVREPTLRLLQAILNHLDPDLPYDDWFAVAAALFHTSGGCEDAYLLFDSWSATGRKYRDDRETLALWKSLRLDHPRPRTIGTLRYMLQEDGISWDEIVDAAVEGFDVVDDGSDQ